MTDFAAITDWKRYVEDCLHSPVHADLSPDLNIDAGLSKLGSELASTPYAPRFLEAVLDLLETGSDDDRRNLLRVSLVGARDVGPRVARIASAWRGGALADRIGTLLLRGVEAAPRDPALLAELEVEARIDGQHAIDSLHRATPHNVDWVADHLCLLPMATDADGGVLVDLAWRTRTADLPRFVDGIVAAGSDYVDHFLAALGAPGVGPHQVQELRPVLAANPAFAGRVP